MDAISVNFSELFQDIMMNLLRAILKLPSQDVPTIHLLYETADDSVESVPNFETHQSAIDSSLQNILNLVAI